MVIIGVHTPETEREKKDQNVIDYVKEHKITYPVLLDQKGENWNRWSQRWWPTVWVVDRKGMVRYRWTGELDWQGAGGEKFMGQRIEGLVKERP